MKLKGTDPNIDQAVDRALALAGFQMTPMSEAFCNEFERAKSDGDTIAAVGTWLNYQKFGGDLGVSARTKMAILLGRVEYGRSYQQALSRLRTWQIRLQQALQHVDFIALPTMQSIPPVLMLNLRVGVMDARMLRLQNTVPVNCAGNPAISLPVSLDSRAFPVAGLQLIGRPRVEAELLNAGRIVEAALKK